jgi:hypothetical protein
VGRSEDSAERVLAFTSAYADALAPKLKEASTVDELLEALEPNSDMALDVLAKLHKQDKWTGSASTIAAPVAATPAAYQQQQQQRPQQQAGGPSRRGNRSGKRWPTAQQGGPPAAAYPPAGYTPYTTHHQAGGYHCGQNFYGAAGYSAPAAHRRGECVFNGLGTLGLLGRGLGNRRQDRTRPSGHTHAMAHATSKSNRYQPAYECGPVQSQLALLPACCLWRCSADRVAAVRLPAAVALRRTPQNLRCDLPVALCSAGCQYLPQMLCCQPAASGAAAQTA